MGLGREKLDVYRLANGYVAWAYEKAGALEGVHHVARDQWLRASQSIPLNIAEGNGKTSDADRRRDFEIDRGPALECAAIQDVLVVGKRPARRCREQTEAKFWIRPTVNVADNEGFAPHELRKIMRLVEDNTVRLRRSCIRIAGTIDI